MGHCYCSKLLAANQISYSLVMTHYPPTPQAQETGVWKYSLLQHFEQFHEGCDLLQEEVLGDDERDHIINNC